MEREQFLKNILVPIDGSPSSISAEETAGIIAKKTGAAVTVFHVMLELSLGHQIPENVQEDLVKSIEQQADRIVSNARALLSEENVNAETETIAATDVAESILQFSKQNCDLIVMGAHGENEEDPFALGSVTKRVMVHTICPTLIVKKPTTLSNLLVCIDGSDNAIKALQYAVNLANKLDSKIVVLNVQEHLLRQASSKAAEELGERVLSKVLATAQKERLRIEKKLEFGVPSHKIVEFAEKGKYDLVVLGSRGLGTVKRFLLGSVSDDVVHKAKCSVLVVPPKK